MNPPVYTRSKIVENLEEDVGQLCCIPTWAIQGLWSMSNKWWKAGRGSILGHRTGQGKLRKIFLGRVVLKSEISPGLRKESPTKGRQVPPRLSMIGIPKPQLRETVK